MIEVTLKLTSGDVEILENYRKETVERLSDSKSEIICRIAERMKKYGYDELLYRLIVEQDYK